MYSPLSFLIFFLLGAVQINGSPRSVRWIEPRNKAGTLGKIECAVNGVQYTVYDDQAFSEVFENPSEKGDSIVYRIAAGGLENDPRCHAIKIPGFHSIFIPVGECNTQWVTIGEQAVYDNFVIITVRTFYAPDVYDDVIFRQPFKCQADLDASVAIKPITYVNEIVNMDGMTGEFDINLEVSSKNESIPNFLGSKQPKQVITITIDVLPENKPYYQAYIDRCWATTKADKDSSPQHYLVEARGCIPENNAKIVSTNQTTPITLQFAAVKFLGVDSSQLYFHCHVNLCKKFGFTDNCQQSCGARGGRFGLGIERASVPAKRIKTIGYAINEDELGAVIQGGHVQIVD